MTTLCDIADQFPEGSKWVRPNGTVITATHHSNYPYDGTKLDCVGTVFNSRTIDGLLRGPFITTRDKNGVIGSSMPNQLQVYKEPPTTYEYTVMSYLGGVGPGFDSFADASKVMAENYRDAVIKRAKLSEHYGTRFYAAIGTDPNRAKRFDVWSTEEAQLGMQVFEIIKTRPGFNSDFFGPRDGGYELKQIRGG